MAFSFAARFAASVNCFNTAVNKIPVWFVYALAVLPLMSLLWKTITASLGADPVRALEQALGLYGLQVLIVGLAITPLHRLLRINLLRFRRALGLIGFFYIALHMLVWLILDMQLFWQQIIRDISKQPYVALGMVAFVALIPLAITSSHAMVKRMGAKNWRKLHKLVYFAVIAGALHAILMVKAWPIEQVAYFIVIIVLLLLRFLKQPWIYTKG